MIQMMSRFLDNVAVGRGWTEVFFYTEAHT
jgi:hypothetical protein